MHDGKRSLALDVPLEPYFYRGGEESEERGGQNIRGSREGWRIFVLVLAGFIFAVIYSVLGTQTRK